MMINGGTGSTTADCRHSQVRIELPENHSFRLTKSWIILLAVLYRSKTDSMPDFSKEDGPAGEAFFDVRVNFKLSSK
jgi:hypothetical protein